MWPATARTVVSDPDPPVDALAESVCSYIETEHASVLDAVGECADAVAATWPSSSTGNDSSGVAVEETAKRPEGTGDPEPTHGTTDRDRVVPPLRALLADRSLLDALPGVLAESVAAAGYDLPAVPVPAPPYVAVTSVGPVLRATLPPGRLVVTLRVFDVTRPPEGRPRYVRLRDGGPAMLDVTVR